MKRVYICSALRGDIEGNIAKAADYCRWAMVTHGVLPIAPHIYFTQFLDDTVPAERKIGMNAGLELLKDCDELWYFGDRVTQGMVAEINMAQKLGIAVKYVDGREINMYQEWRNPYDEISM